MRTIRAALIPVIAVFALFPFSTQAQSTLYSNSTTGDVGIGTATPQGLLTVYGASTVASSASAKLDYVSLPAATTTITGTTGITTAKGFNAASLYKPTYTDSSAVTITNAATLYVDSAPAAAGSVTITNPWAISVGAGNVSFPGTGNALGTITSGTWNGSPISLSSYASGTLQAAQFPALTGDVTTSAGSLATTVAKIQGTTVSGTTGTGNVVFSASPTFTGTVTFNGNLGFATPSTEGIVGTTTNDNAAAGNVGEYVSSTILIGSAVGLTTATAKNITSISLTAGDWDVGGNVVYAPAGSTLMTQALGWISSTSATLPTAPNNGGEVGWWGVPPAGASPVLGISTQRISLASTTTIYLSTYTQFSTSTLSGYGFIGARRVR